MLWDELQGANWVSENDNREWRDRALRAEAQAEALKDVVVTALTRAGEAEEPVRRLRAV